MQGRSSNAIEYPSVVDLMAIRPLYRNPDTLNVTLFSDILIAVMPQLAVMCSFLNSSQSNNLISLFMLYVIYFYCKYIILNNSNQAFDAFFNMTGGIFIV